MSQPDHLSGNFGMNKRKKQKHSLVGASKLPSSGLVEAGIAAPAVDLTAILAAAKGSSSKRICAQRTTLKMQVRSLVKQTPEDLKKSVLTTLISVLSRRRDHFRKLTKISAKKQKQSLPNGSRCHLMW